MLTPINVFETYPAMLRQADEAAKAILIINRLHWNKTSQLSQQSMSIVIVFIGKVLKRDTF